MAKGHSDMFWLQFNNDDDGVILLELVLVDTYSTTNAAIRPICFTFIKTWVNVNIYTHKSIVVMQSK